MITQHIQAKKVLYDLKNRALANTKTKDTIYFDSESEYQCFQILDKLFDPDIWKIDIHNKLLLPGLSWKLDFTIYPKQKNDIISLKKLQKLCEIINNCKLDIFPDKIFVEFKGYQDSNFTKKMKMLMSDYPTFSKQVILCSEHESAFGFWDEKNNQSCTHFIASCYTLKKIIQSIV